MCNAKILQTVLLLLVIITGSSTLMAAIITVDVNGQGDFTKIQEAIDSAKNFDSVVVHPATYMENINFRGKAITVISLDPNDSEMVANTIIEGDGSGPVVAFHQGETEYSSLTGFTVQNGTFGIECKYSSSNPQIKSCVIRSNLTGITGGKPSITSCAIEWNNGDGINDSSGEVNACDISNNGGRGVYILWKSLTLRNCTILQNGGHGVYVYGNSLTLNNCTISRNGKGVEKPAPGPGIFVAAGTLTMRNSIVSGNAGAGIRRPYLVELGNFAPPDASITMLNCTVVGNGGWGYDAEYAGSGDNLTVENNIIAYNKLGGLRKGGMLVGRYYGLRYNNFFANAKSDGPTGGLRVHVGTTYENPWFVASGYFDPNIADPNAEWVEGDYHLMSSVGTWDPTSQDWVQYPIDSPCLDKGDPNAPYLEEPYENGGRLNLGAYGNTFEASMSKGGAKCLEYPVMDFNKDCKVDQLDLELFMEHWLECNLDPQDACWPDGIPEYPLKQ